MQTILKSVRLEPKTYPGTLKQFNALVSIWDICFICCRCFKLEVCQGESSYKTPSPYVSKDALLQYTYTYRLEESEHQDASNTEESSGDSSLPEHQQ